MGISELLTNLITDRTQADVDYALALQANSVHTPVNLRGAYNISDRNRVGDTINWLIAAMNILRLRAKNNWNEYDIVKVADNANVLACLTELQRVLPYGKITAVPADLDKLSYQKANAVERILVETGRAYSWIADNTLYCNESYASNITAPINKFI